MGAHRCAHERTSLAEGVAPLTDAERAWVRSLERVFRSMPNRLLLIESADSISVVDRAAALGERSPELHDGKADENGVALCNVRHSFGVLTGVSG